MRALLIDESQVDGFIREQSRFRAVIVIVGDDETSEPALITRPSSLFKGPAVFQVV